jgi:hypothetical protein
LANDYINILKRRLNAQPRVILLQDWYSLSIELFST